MDTSRELKENKKGQSAISNQLSFSVTSKGEISNFLIEDLDRVLQLETLDFDAPRN